MNIINIITCLLICIEVSEKITAWLIFIKINNCYVNQANDNIMNRRKDVGKQMYSITWRLWALRCFCWSFWTHGKHFRAVMMMICLTNHKFRIEWIYLCLTMHYLIVFDDRLIHPKRTIWILTGLIRVQVQYLHHLLTLFFAQKKILLKFLQENRQFKNCLFCFACYALLSLHRASYCVYPMQTNTHTIWNSVR